MSKVLLFANTDWYLYNFRRSLAETLRNEGWEVVLASPDGDYRKRLQRSLGFRWTPVKLASWNFNPIAQLLSLRVLCVCTGESRPTYCFIIYHEMHLLGHHRGSLGEAIFM